MAKKNDPTAPSGILVVDKPAGMTSHDVVARIRRLARTRKVGHAGTLDPMATGVLIIGLGKATRLLTWITGHSKAYDATVRFGVRTATEDFEGEITAATGCDMLTTGQIEAAMAPLRGDIMQVPSAVSAIKIDGKRAHALVREGADVQIPARPVTIYELTLSGEPASTRCVIPLPAFEQKTDNAHVETAVIPPSLRMEVPVVDAQIHAEVSSGTYIRALGRDLGDALGCGAHLTALRRTRVGAFTLADAHPLAELERIAAEYEETIPRDEEGRTSRPNLPITPLNDAVLAMFPRLDLDDRETKLFSHGQAPSRPREEVAHLAQTAGEEPIAAVSADGQTVMGLLRVQGTKLVTVLVFA